MRSSATPRLTEAPVRAATYQAAMRRLPTTVVVAGAMDGSRPIGMVVGTFTSVSLDPPLVGFLGDAGSSTVPLLLRQKHLSFNVLGDGDTAVANEFRKPVHERFESLEWTTSAWNTPVLASAIVTFQTALHAVAEAGDHKLILGEVLEVEQRRAFDRPLVFVEGRMTRLDPTLLVSPQLWSLGWE